MLERAPKKNLKFLKNNIIIMIFDLAFTTLYDTKAVKKRKKNKTNNERKYFKADLKRLK